MSSGSILVDDLLVALQWANLGEHWLGPVWGRSLEIQMRTQYPGDKR